MFRLFSPKAHRSPARYRQSLTVMSVDHGAKTVLLDSRSEQFFALDHTGRRIWSLIAEPMTSEEVVAALRGEFEVSDEELAADVESFLAELAHARLVEAE